MIAAYVYNAITLKYIVDNAIVDNAQKSKIILQDSNRIWKDI